MDRLDKDSEVFCSLNDEEFRERRALARRNLIPQIVDSERSQNALQFTFRRSEHLRQNIEEFVALEQQCCSFLTFEFIKNGGVSPSHTAIDSLGRKA